MKEITPGFDQGPKTNESEGNLEKDLKACLVCAKDLAGCQTCEHAFGKKAYGETKTGEYGKNHPPHVENKNNNQ